MPLTGWLAGYDVSVDDFPAEIRPNAKAIEYIKARIVVRPTILYQQP
jgi:hypothetical protein